MIYAQKYLVIVAAIFSVVLSSGCEKDRSNENVNPKSETSWQAFRGKPHGSFDRILKIEGMTGTQLVESFGEPEQKRKPLASDSEILNALLTREERMSIDQVWIYRGDELITRFAYLEGDEARLGYEWRSSF